MSQKPQFRVDWVGRSYTYTEEEIAAVAEVMRGTATLTKGAQRDKFERAFAEYNSLAHAFTVTSAASALELAAVFSGVGQGDEVIMPSHTYCASAIPFGRSGATLRWADIDPDTRVVSAASIEKLINPKTKAIVVVHLYGLMADMDPIMALAAKHNLKVIEDCAQAIGAEYKGKKAGSFGDYAAYSFHTQKNLTTLGEGGVFGVKSDADAALVRRYSHNGHIPYEEPRENYWTPAMVNVDTIFGTKHWPYNFPMTEAQCALGIKTLARLDQMTADRITRGQRFLNALKDFPELSFQKISPDHKHCFHLMAAKYDGSKWGKHRDDFIKMMAFEFGVKVICQYYPLNRYPLFEKMGFGEADCPNTDHFYDNMVSFPFHLWMSDDDFQYMIDSTLKTLRALRGE